MIELKKDYLEIIKIKRNFKNVKDINNTKELKSEIDITLDVLSKVNKMIENIKENDYKEINIEDYNKYLFHLEHENYEELKKYKLK